MNFPSSAASDTVHVAAGEIVFRQGDEGDCAYLIEEGIIEIRMEGDVPRVLGVRGPGELIGEMAIIHDGKRVATVLAQTDCRLTYIGAQRIRRGLENADPLLRMVLDTLMERVGAILTGTTLRSPFLRGDVARREAMIVEAIEQIRRESDLRFGLERGEVTLHFQPIVSLGDGAIVGFEGLARWNHPERGMISPGEFIPIAEASGMIGALTRHSLEQAAKALHFLDDGDPASARPAAFVNVNVSSHDLIDPSFSDFLVDFVERWPIARGRLKIEITESALMSDPEQALSTLRLCRTIGIGVAIDDFGIGYSSLSYLHRLPIDVLKIDQSFIRGMAADAHSAKIVRTILALADEIGVPVVSEGLELPAEVLALTRMGCALGQGYHFARAMPIEATGAFLSSWPTAPQVVQIV